MQTFLEYRNKLHESTNHPMIKHGDKMVHKTNSDNDRIHPTDAGIKSFHNWFGGSKITDKHGRPQVISRGIHDLIKNNTKLDKTLAITSSKNNMSGFSPLYANIRNPLVVDCQDKKAIDGLTCDKIKASGNDGAVFKTDYGPANHQMMAVDPSQIKSAADTSTAAPASAPSAAPAGAAGGGSGGGGDAGGGGSA